MSDQLRDAFVLMRALRERPRTVSELAAETEIPWRKVYRLLEQMVEFGAPIKRGVGARRGKVGLAPTTYAITVSALREWLG